MLKIQERRCKLVFDFVLAKGSFSHYIKEFFFKEMKKNINSYELI